MMNDLQKMEQEKSVLRWGGLAGVLGGILFILTWVVLIAGPVGMEDPADLAGWVTRFPDIRAARVVENGIYLVGLLLEVTLFLALLSPAKLFDGRLARMNGSNGRRREALAGLAVR
jgi:hypothetical protein